MKHSAGVIKPKVELTEVALTPNPDLPMDEAVRRAAEQGFDVIRVDGRRIIVKEK